MDRSWISKLAAPARDAGRVLAIAWRMDAQLTFLYYLTAVVAALAPLASGWILSLLIDRVIGSVVTVPVIVVVVVATHVAIVAIKAAVRSGLHERYYDDALRDRLQDTLTDRLCEVRSTHPWRVPDLFRALACAVIASVGALAAAIAVAQFGWWIVPLVIASAAPRVVLCARSGEPCSTCRKRWYVAELMSEASAPRDREVFRAAPVLLSRHRATARTFAHRKQTLGPVIASIVEGAVVLAIAWSRLHDVTTGVLSLGSFALFVTMLRQLAMALPRADAR